MQLATLRAAIIAHPLRAVGTAVLAGACIALLDARRPAGKPTLLGVLVAALLRDVARGEARSWLDARHRPFARA